MNLRETYLDLVQNIKENKKKLRILLAFEKEIV